MAQVGLELKSVWILRRFKIKDEFSIIVELDQSKTQLDKQLIVSLVCT